MYNLKGKTCWARCIIPPYALDERGEQKHTLYPGLDYCLVVDDKPTFGTLMCDVYPLDVKNISSEMRICKSAVNNFVDFYNIKPKLAPLETLYF